MTDIGLYENVYYKKSQTQQNDENNHLQKVQENADELVEILQDNFKKVLDRKEKLNDLNVISRDLEQSASAFQECSVKVKRKQWWAHMKTRLVFAGLATILLIIIILLIIQHTN